LTGPGSLVPAGSEPSRRSEGKPLARPGGAAPLHQAAAMGLESDKLLRQECWDLMGKSIRDRLGQKAGNIIEWWASMDFSSPDGRPAATVFGDRALCIAEPRVNTDHRPVYRLSSFEFDPGMLRIVSIDHRPPPSPATPRNIGKATVGPPVTDIGLTSSDQGVLGNLPPRAQELLQAPFLSGQKAIRCSWHYEGHEHHLTMFMFYIAGARDVTMACGSKTIPVGHSDTTAHWSLRLYRAPVLRRVGK
jgi:hypothetical protein